MPMPTRADACYKLGGHRKAIDDYTSALNTRPDWAEAEKNRAIVQGVPDEIARKKAEEERRRKKDEERKGKEFEFKTVSVDSKGKINQQQKGESTSED